MQAWCLASEGFSFHVRKCSMAGEHPCHSHSSPDFCSHSPLHTLIHTPCSQDWSTAPGRGTRGTWVSVCEQMNGDGKYTVQIIYICATQPPCPQVGGMMFKSLTGTAGIPRRQFPAPAFAVFAENKVLMVDCFAAERKREAAGSGPRQLNNAPEPHLPSAMQQCRWLSVETCRKKTLAPEQGVL